MAISLVRIDDRVIHGQTVTRWAANLTLNGFIVISDKVASDDLQKKVLRAAAGHFPIGIYNTKQGVAALEKAKASKKSFFVITDKVEELRKVVENGGDFGKKLNVGNMTVATPGSKNLGNAVVMNDEDFEAFDYLASKGIEMNFQLTPDSKASTWPQIKAKYQAA